MIAAPGTYSIGFVLAIKLPNGRIKFNFSLLLRSIIDEFHASVAKNTSLDRLDAIVRIVDRINWFITAKCSYLVNTELRCTLRPNYPYFEQKRRL